jgi:hypothetical protein
MWLFGDGLPPCYDAHNRSRYSPESFYSSAHSVARRPASPTNIERITADPVPSQQNNDSTEFFRQALPANLHAGISPSDLGKKILSQAPVQSHFQIDNESFPSLDVHGPSRMEDPMQECAAQHHISQD